MLDQLIESKNHLNENRRRGSFLLTAFTAVTFFFTLALIYSLFSYNLAMASEKLELSSLVAPVPIPVNDPQPPEPKVETVKPVTDKSNTNELESRVKNIQRLEETPIKDSVAVSTEQNKNLSRPNGLFKISQTDSTSSSLRTQRNAENGSGIGRPLEIKSQNKAEELTNEEPPVIKKAQPKDVPEQQKIIRTSKVLNSKAKDLVIPRYPPVARAVHAFGAVNVQVTIDEDGNVTSATALSGHQLLRQAAEQAALKSKFTPTFLGEQKVKVTGVIVYNFIAQ